MSELQMAITRARAVPRAPAATLVLQQIVDELSARTRALEMQVASLSAQLRGPEAPKADAGLFISEIKKAVCRAYNITLTDLMSDRRTLDAVLPRQIAMYLMRHLTTMSLPLISRHLGKKDHTTILYGVRRIEQLRKNDERLGAEIRALEEQLAPHRTATHAQ